MITKPWLFKKKTHTDRLLQHEIPEDNGILTMHKILRKNRFEAKCQHLNKLMFTCKCN